MSQGIAIDVAGVSLVYRLRNRTTTSLKGALLRALAGRGSGTTNDFVAINNLSFQLRRGEILGVVGRNGSGKSSLLRLLAGTQQPTHGTITVRARVGSLLSLGGSFHMESTGRENIFLHGLLLGMAPGDIEASIPSIIEFADLGGFIDSPVRTYSSGMLARLGFAIAAHVESDVLLIDEILSVGDQWFRARCEEWFQARLRAGVSAVIVSHDVEELRRLCERVLWLERGVLQGLGDKHTVLHHYVINEPIPSPS